MKSTEQFKSAAIPATLAMATPGVRLVVVLAWSSEPGPDGRRPHEGHEVYPGLAVIAQQQFEYTRRAVPGKFFDTAPTHREMERLGWAYEGLSDWIDFDVIIATDDWGLAPASKALSGSNTTHAPVVCEWPRREDEKRLAPIVARLLERAREKVDRQRQSRTPAAVAS